MLLAIKLKNRRYSFLPKEHEFIAMFKRYVDTIVNKKIPEPSIFHHLLRSEWNKMMEFVNHPGN